MEKLSQSQQGHPAGCGIRLSHVLVFLCILRNSHDAPQSGISFLLAKPTSSVHGERGSRTHSGPGLVFVAGAECKRENGKKEMGPARWPGSITGALEDFCSE